MNDKMLNLMVLLREICFLVVSAVSSDALCGSIAWVVLLV
jgi:hypothetical protein